jgi:hypothetical protein
VKRDRPTLEELMRPTVITCGRCGGELHVIPVREDLGKGKTGIRTINICGKCTFEKRR